MCQGYDRDPCVIKNWLAPIDVARDWKKVSDGDGDEEEEEGGGSWE